jgi:replicative DNA helicase
MISAYESERELLGAVLMDRLAWSAVSAQVAPEDWGDSDHRAVAALIEEVASKGRDWDGVAVVQSAPPPIRAVVGDLMAGQYFFATKPETHIARVVSASRRRKLVAECQRVARDAVDEEDADLAISNAQGAMLSLLGRSTTEAAVSVSDAAGEWLEEIERRMDATGDILGISSGLSTLDEITGGFEPGQLIVVAGRPSHGKTTLAMNIAEHAMLREDKSVLVFSLEMGRQELVSRMAASVGRVDMGRFKKPKKLDQDDWARISSAIASVHQKPLYIDDSGGLHFNQIKARARAHMQRHGCQLIVVDYLGLVKADSTKPYEATTQISGAMKALAKELQVPVILVAQLNREVDKRTTPRPVMSDLRDSGAVEQDADKIIFIWRQEVYEPENVSVSGQAEAIVAKNRNGETGLVPLFFVGKHNRFAVPAYGYDSAFGPRDAA